MDIVKTAVEWTKAEMLSSSFFVLFGVMFVLGSAGFWKLGKTELAKAYTVPFLVAGILLLVIGLGIFFQSYGRVTSFPRAFDSDPQAFLASELARAEAVLAQYKVAVFRVIPLLIVLCAILYLVLDGPIWRASFVSAMIMLALILVVDTNANQRLEGYQKALKSFADKG